MSKTPEAIFDDISIVGVDKSRTYQPNPPMLLYHVYLELSKQPPYEWGEILVQEHKFPRTMKWRRAWVEGQYIVVNCPLNEVQEHLDYLKQDVKNTNEKYRTWKQKEIARKQALDKKRADDDKRKNDLLDDLDFD